MLQTAITPFTTLAMESSIHKNRGREEGRFFHGGEGQQGEYLFPDLMQLFNGC